MIKAHSKETQDQKTRNTIQHITELGFRFKAYISLEPFKVKGLVLKFKAYISLEPFKVAKLQ